jgi:hypothetical protein
MEIQVLIFVGIGVCIVFIIVDLCAALFSSRTFAPGSTSESSNKISFKDQYSDRGAQRLVIMRPRSGKENRALAASMSLTMHRSIIKKHAGITGV